MALTERLTAIGNAIREKNGTTELIPLTDMPQAILDISGGGGYDEGYVAGELAGRENQQSDFWDAFQYNGDRVDYQFSFGGAGWTDETFKPKYNIQPIYAMRMFNTSKITNLKSILENLGITLNFSKMTSGIELFGNSTITHIGVIDLTSMNNINQVFYQAKSLQSIEKVILKSDGSQAFNSSTTFGGCSALTHIIIEGTIGQNNFDIHWSDLDRESLLSILNALADKSSETSSVWKITIGATNKAKLSADELKIASDKGWSVE
jgi:hypothetical protein